MPKLITLRKGSLKELIYWSNNFTQGGIATGFLLLFAALAAIVWANSPFSESYFHIWETTFSLQFGDYVLDKNLHHWINDGLMAVFFFVVGLEIKKEVIGGSLATPMKAVLPIGAAIGGMVFPALIYLLLNQDAGATEGWGVPMATDIAFTLGILALLGNRIPKALKVFLMALAIVDDLGAVLVIAFFYTSNISVFNLSIGLVFVLILIAGNVFKIRSTTFYAIIGIGGVWLAFLMSGVHATIAGVIAAFTIPARTEYTEQRFLEKLNRLLSAFNQSTSPKGPLLSSSQTHIIEEVKIVSDRAQTPLQKLEHAMTPLVNYIIMPLFAFANAGVLLSGDSINNLLLHPIALGVILGLVLGKFLGISLFSKLLVMFKLSELPQGVSWRHIIGASLMAGIGFTMSLFIAELAFTIPENLVRAKAGILIASVIAAILGTLILLKKKVKS